MLPQVAVPPMRLKPQVFRSLVCPQGLALGTLLCTASPAAAQETTPKTQNSTEDLAEVVVEASRNAPAYKAESVSSPKFTQPLRDIPQSITVIPQAVIQEQGATSLRDVLRNVPGISMQAGEGGGGPAGDNLSIRGFTARSDIFVDGIRDTAGGGYSRDPFNIEQVEVAKGPASANSGRGSTGGSINLSTKTPQLNPFYRGESGLGSDHYFRSTLDINVPLWVNPGGAQAVAAGKSPAGKEPVPSAGPERSGSAFRLNAMYHDAGIPGRDEVNNQRWGAAPSLAFGIGADSRLILTYMHLYQDNVPDYGLPWVPRTSTNPLLPPGVPPVEFNNFYGLLSRDHEFITTDLGTAIFEHDFSNTVTFRTALRYGRNDRDSITTAPRFANVNTSTTVNRQFQSRDQLDETVGIQSDIRWDFQTGGLKHQLVAGTEAARDDSRNDVRVSSTGVNPSTSLYDPNPWDPYTGVISYNGSYTSTTSGTLAFYLFDTVELNKKWTASGGLRWDSFDVDYENRSAAPALTLTELQQDVSDVSFRAALNYKPTETGTLYLGYGTSFNPSTEGLTYIAPPSGTNSTASLLDADPETSRTLELGGKWDLIEEKLALTAAVFRTEKTNARTTDPADPTIVLLTGEQVVQGFEIGFSGAITDSWRLIGGYTYLDSEVTQSANAAEVGNEVSNTPEHSFSLWTIHDLPAGFQAGAGAQYTGARYNNANTDTRQRAGGYFTVDAMISYQINDNISLRLNGYNLFDRDYIDRVGGGHFIPGAGRSVSLTASFNF